MGQPFSSGFSGADGCLIFSPPGAARPDLEWTQGKAGDTIPEKNGAANAPQSGIA